MFIRGIHIRISIGITSPLSKGILCQVSLEESFTHKEKKHRILKAMSTRVIMNKAIIISSCI